MYLRIPWDPIPEATSSLFRVGGFLLFTFFVCTFMRRPVDRRRRRREELQTGFGSGLTGKLA
ncbi:hypothetical protein BJX64DRAFT_252734 [Aspergillus heterothallicus]